MSIVKRFTFEERQKIEEFVKLGIPIKKMGVLLNRCYYSVRNEIYRFGGRGNYTANAAQAESERRKKKKYATQSKKLKEHAVGFFDLVNRITNLEQQIDIILDVIKKECNYDSKKN